MGNAFICNGKKREFEAKEKSVSKGRCHCSKENEATQKVMCSSPWRPSGGSLEQLALPPGHRLTHGPWEGIDLHIHHHQRKQRYFFSDLERE